MRPGAQCSAETGGGWRRLLARSCAVLGGTIAGTAVLWAVSSASASAEDTLADQLGLSSATAVVDAGRELVDETVDRVANTLPGARKAVEAVRDAEALRVPLTQRPALLDTQQANHVPAAQPEREPRHSAPAGEARTLHVGDEVAAAGTGPAPDGASRARSLRTTSGTDGSTADTDDAPPAHAPASVPPLPVSPVAAASGCPSGSSLTPALVGLPAPGDVVARGKAVPVPVPPCGLPDTTGAQPGTSPD